MKIAPLMLFIASTSATCVFAEEQLPPPPVLDHSTYRGGLYESVQPPSQQLQINTPILTPPSLPAATDGLGRLQNDVSQLKSRVDEQGRALLNLKQRQDAIEQRSLNPNTGIAPQLGGVAPTTAVPVISAPPISTVAAGEKARYQNAYTLFRNGHLDQSIAEFKGVIASYPAGEFADNSQYWIGEALLKKGDKNNALLAFDQVVRSYPRSAKVPDALLKIGMTQLTLKNKAKAKEYLDFVVKNYPGTSAAGLAAAKKSQAGI